MSAADIDQERQFREQMQRVERLIANANANANVNVNANSEAGEAVREMAEALVSIHGIALNRIMTLAAQTPGGSELVTRLGSDPVVASILLLHELHPTGVELRVTQALASSATLLRSMGGAVSVLAVAQRTVRVRLARGRDDSVDRLRQTLDDVVYQAAPEIEAIEVEEVILDRPLKVSLPVVSR